MLAVQDGGVKRGGSFGAGEPTNATLVAFSMPMLVIVGVELAWRVYLPAHLAAALRLPLTTIGLLLPAARLFDMAADPLVAWASDRYPTRWGHRRPWLVAAVPPIMLGTAGVFFVWPWTGPATVVAAGLLLHIGVTMLCAPHGGWALELARTPGGRLRVMAARTWFALAGMVVLLLLPSVMERAWGTNHAGQVAALGVALLVVAPTVVFLLLRFVDEPALPAVRDDAHRGALAPFRILLAMPALRPILSLYLLAGLAETGSAAIFRFLVDRVLDLHGWGSTLLLLQAGVTLGTLPLWSRLGQGMGYRRLLALCCAWELALAPAVLILPAGSTVWAIAFVLARGLFGGVAFMVLRAMVAGIARIAADRGQRSGAICYSVSNITLRLGMGAGPLLVFGLLSAAWIDGLQEAADLSPWRSTGFRCAYAVPPMMANAAALAILFAGKPSGVDGETRRSFH